MNGEVILANKALNYNNIKKLKTIIDNNENIVSIKIQSSRKIKRNKIVLSDKKDFDNIDSFIKYLEDGEVNKLEKITIEFDFSNRNKGTLEYSEFLGEWCLKFDKQDSNVDSIIFNLKSMIKDNIFRKYRKNRIPIILTLVVFGVLYYKSFTDTPYENIFAIVLILLEIDHICFKNCAYKDNKFINKNKDAIILSIIFYILGVITPYILQLVQKMISNI